MTDAKSISGQRPEQLMETSSLNDLLTVATAVLHQAVDLVNESLSSDEQLTFQSTYIPGSTIGKLF